MLVRFAVLVVWIGLVSPGRTAIAQIRSDASPNASTHWGEGKETVSETRVEMVNR
jgi:hypothetical protein